MNNKDKNIKSDYKPPFYTEQKTMRLPTAPPKQHRFRWILLGVLIVIVISLAGAYAGYASAIKTRIHARDGYRAVEAVKQFQLVSQDQEAGRYSVAVERLEYIISIDPDFPGAADKLQEIMMQAAQAGQVIEPSISSKEGVAPTIEPTKDTREAEQIFASAQQLINAGDWTGALAALDNVRNANIDYQAVDVDGMYYVALRYQGIEKISQGNLEGGIYNMALASRFGPLDKEAENYRSWARQYLTGVAFWEVDWGKVVGYFANIINSLPNLRDGSGVTAAERYRIANLRYADNLIWDGDYCGAEPYIQTGLSLSSDEYIIATATQLALYCRPPEPTATPEPTKDTTVIEATAVPTSSGGGESPTDVPTEAPTSSGPSDTDGDTITDDDDNCVDDANTDQADDDGDGIGNVCDPDYNAP